MTVTDTPRPGAVSARQDDPDPASAVTNAAPGGLAGVVGTGDHKVVGRLFIGGSLLFVLVAGVAGQLLSIDRVDGTRADTILTRDTFAQVFTLHSTAAVFLFLLPLLLGVALCVVPLQVGSTTVAFPRAAAASFWGWLVGGALLVAAYVINGGPGGGSADGVRLWTAAFAMVLVALVLGALCVVTTVLTLRAPGMDLARVPLFSWSMLVAGVLWLLTLPVLVGLLVLIYVDHRYGRVRFGDNATIYARLRWTFFLPQVYAFAVPTLGFIGDVVPVSARARTARRPVAFGAIAVFGALGFGAFAQTAVYDGAANQPVYDAMAILAVLPVLALLGGWATTIRGGRPRLISPLLFAVAALLMLLVAVLAGAIASIDRFDLQGTLFDTGQVHYTTLAATIAGIGALWYWATKIVGRPLPEGLGRLAAVVLLLGTVLLALPDLLSGAFGEGRDAGVGIEALNAASAAGGALTILGVLLAVLGLLGGLRGRRRDRGVDTADEDPWDGHTLEWATASPPAPENFAEPPEVTSAEPLLDRREAAATSGEGVA